VSGTFQKRENYITVVPAEIVGCRTMTSVLQVLALLFVSVAMAQALAHSLEFPGKPRLSRRDYETFWLILAAFLALVAMHRV
jgi:hypothetical protein